MPAGNLALEITDLRKRSIARTVITELRRDRGNNGAGGGDFDFTVDPTGATTILLNGIPTRGGPGSLHTIRVLARGYTDFAFQQFITQGDQKGLQRVYLVRDAKQVASIDAPAYEELPAALKAWLDSARMTAFADEDGDLVGKRGKALYEKLGPFRKAAVLNIFAKANHKGTVGLIWSFFRAPLVIRQDRCFVEMAGGIQDHVSDDSRFIPAPRSLHKPLRGFRLSNSVKSNDSHANIQLTFQQSAGGALAADVDIDEQTGFAHWGEVLRNHFTKQRTNPYVVHELLRAADLQEDTLVPNYDLVLKA